MMMRIIPLLFLTLLLASCSEIELASHLSKTAFPPPESVGTFKVGTPYKINNKWYYPKEDYALVETGIASWYGPQFHGKRTANGEIFNMNELTAAHRTLQMPSLVRVTNLENGLSLIVRVNDRGPYKRGRVIDLSKRAARLLDFEDKGTAKVRLEVLKQESLQIAEIAKRGESTRGIEIAVNNGTYAKRNDTAVRVASARPASGSGRPVIETVASERLADTPMETVIPGHLKSGEFYPDPVISEQPVEPSSIYVQAGSFTVRANAYNLSNKLSVLAGASVFPADVNGRTFYRVRLGPLDNVDAADELLAKLSLAGNDEAIIVVD